MLLHEPDAAGNLLLGIVVGLSPRLDSYAGLLLAALVLHPNVACKTGSRK